MLDIENASLVAHSYLNTKGIKSSIYKSKTTNSFYVKIYYNNMSRKIKFSDHLSPKGYVRTLIIKKSTSKPHIKRFVDNTLKILEQRKFWNIMKELEKVG